jgi:glycosyltransferase involved in cell wall biosynthesis
VLVEALACGTPVVATRCGGPEDIVTDDVGRLVGVEDVPALADALLEVLARPHDPARIRAYALERFRWQEIARQAHGVFEEALEGRAMSAPAE